MYKFLLFCAAFIAMTASTSAQSSGGDFTFSNFETISGVAVDVPQPKVQAKPSKNSNSTPGQTGISKIRLTAMNRSIGAPSLPMSANRSLGSFSTGDAKVDGFILSSATRHNVDPLLIYATMHQESSFKPRAMSYKGARGLMQLMPATAIRFGVTNIFDPQQNIEGGVKYLRWLLNTFNGDVRLALAGYNAGEGAVMKYGYSIPPYRETQDYVARITSRYALIHNPNYVRNALRSTSNTSATAQAVNKSVKSDKAIAAPPPPPIYEPTAIIIKLPNGETQLSIN